MNIPFDLYQKVWYMDHNIPQQGSVHSIIISKNSTQFENPHVAGIKTSTNLKNFNSSNVWVFKLC